MTTKTTEAAIPKPREDNFFMPVGNTKPFFKAAFEGFAGTGKTYTSALVAIGLHKRIGSTKPIVMFDTEKSAKFLKGLFEENGIELLVKESKTLADLIETMNRCRDGLSDILIVDSLSHVWEDTIESYKKKYNRVGLQFQDWGVLKPLWKNQFSNRLVNDPYHMIISGRAGYEYENEINEQTGKREIYKSGIKMKVEGETAYEPDMLVLMERFEEIIGQDKKIYRQATIVKDRSTLIDGKIFQNPSYKDFEPAIEAMLSEPKDNVFGVEKSSEGLFKTEEDRGEYVRNKKIALENIEGWLVKVWPSTGAADKKAKLDVIEQIFSTRSWLEVEQMGLDKLLAGLEQIKEIVAMELKKIFPEAEEKDTSSDVLGIEEKKPVSKAGEKMKEGAKRAKEGKLV